EHAHRRHGRGDDRLPGASRAELQGPVGVDPGMSLEWALGDVHDVVSSEIPDRVMLVHGGERRTFREVNDRARALASFLTGRGFGAFRERGGLERWEAGQDRIAILAHNTPEHVEALLGCWK